MTRVSISIRQVLSSGHILFSQGPSLSQTASFSNSFSQAAVSEIPLLLSSIKIRELYVDVAATTT